MRAGEVAELARGRRERGRTDQAGTRVVDSVAALAGALALARLALARTDPFCHTDRFQVDTGKRLCAVQGYADSMPSDRPISGRLGESRSTETAAFRDGPTVALPGCVRVIGYVRVSTEEQATSGVSLAAQADKIRAYAALYDLDLVEVIEDAGASAKSLDRAGLRRALAALRRGEVAGIVVAKLDRLTRSVADMATLIADYFGERAGRSLFSVADSIDTRTAAGRMVLNILISVAQWEREAIGERTRDALRHKRAAGEVYNHAPLGYDAVGGRLVEVADEMRAVAEVRRLAAEGKSQRAICAAMEAAGYRTKRGGAWRPSTVQAILRRCA